ncbi:MAG: putative lipid II flippase FtsW [Actinobacteria bacterium]|nr:MAG: putative lipid II flippase FtsW [Actinomycetota bacterium]
MAERRSGAMKPRRASRGDPPARPSLRLVPSDRRPGAIEGARLARVDLALLFSSAGFLTAVGLVMVLSAGSVSAAQGYGGNSFWYFERQVLYAVVGVVVAVLLARLPPRRWKMLGFPLLGVAAVLMTIAAHPTSGTAFYGASRWIDLGPVTLQPSELAKLGLVATTATILSNKWGKLHDLGQLLIPLAPIVVVVATLGLLQRDLGTTMILCATVFVLLFIAGVRLRYLFVGGAIGAVGVGYLIFGEAYRRTRFFESWLDPWADPKKSGYQLIQGLIAIGSGGWFGTGLGTSRAKWDFLPNAHSDFIFAVIGEELGLLGALVVLIAFGVLVWAGVRIAIHAHDTFERLLAAGVIAWISVQAVINLGAVTGLLPITGVPLPLVSFGGSALVVTLAGIGVLASVARSNGGGLRRRRSGKAAR